MVTMKREGSGLAAVGEHQQSVQVWSATLLGRVVLELHSKHASSPEWFSSAIIARP
jgi:hypothetical protein